MSTTEALISDAELQLATAGFKTSLWQPEFGWAASEAEASAAPHAPQLAAALQCFLYMFVAGAQRAWVHLAAEMQAGKTGVVNALLRLVFANSLGAGSKLRFTPDRVFVITGMNDTAWVKQTKERLPLGVRSGVSHNGGLDKIVRALHKLAEPAPLANVLIVVDESHIASSSANRPNSLIYTAVARLCPRELWDERGIRFLTISATDPAKAVAMEDARMPFAARVVVLKTDERYQSVASLAAADRLRYVETFGDMHKIGAIEELKRAVGEFPEPLHHIIRCRYGKQDAVETMLRLAFPTGVVMKWDSLSRPSGGGGGGGGGGEDTSSSAKLEDINEVLREAPAQHTFILLKNMFYASKTMDDTHVGVLWDRVSGKDDTNLQSLLGRACGYGKSKRTVVYTSKQTVANYLTFWKEVIGGGRPEGGAAADLLDKKMAGTRVTGGAAAPVVRATGGHATPAGTGLGGGGGGGGPEPPAKVRKNEDDFEAVTREFASFAEAKAWATHIHEPEKVDGFYKTSTTGKPRTLRYDEVVAFCNGKKTAGLPSNMKVGGKVNRLSVGYKDLGDAASAVFVVRRITRIK
jgi:hypothetical protein